MTPWLIDPIDSLIFGEGKPGTAVPGSTLRSRSLPPPTALAGAVRARLFDAEMSVQPTGSMQALADGLRQRPVYGPLVVQLDEAGQLGDWLFPRPLDALELGDNSARTVYPLRPAPWPRGCTGSDAGFWPLTLGEEGPDGKPWHRVRPLWRWSSELLPWLKDPREFDVPQPLGVGVEGPLTERRTHVALEAGRGTARDGALFTTEGRRWIAPRAGGGFDRLALCYMLDGAIPQDVRPLGGERRMATWWACPKPWPSLPKEIEDKIAHDRAARLVLATPALFLAGALPDPSAPFGLPGARLIAATNERPEVVSGWSLRPTGGGRPGPKPTQRLVPAGAVYFLDLKNVDEASLRAWAQSTWLRPVSESPQARADGLGLALLGVSPPL